MSAILAVSVTRGSTTISLRLICPLPVKKPRGKMEYRDMCRGWACAGLQPQKIIRSARFLTSPSVQEGRPISWIAIRDVPWQVAAVLSQHALLRLGNLVTHALGLAVGRRPAEQERLFRLCEHLGCVFNSLIIGDLFP